jgi:hypothetical protein
MFRTKGRFDNKKISEFLRSNKQKKVVPEIKQNTSSIPGKGYAGNDIIFKV